MTRTVLEAAERGGTRLRPEPRITDPYADFLRHTARAVGLYGQARFAEDDGGRSVDRALDEAVAELRRVLRALHRSLPDTARHDPAALATHGTLLAQAHRLADQLAPE